MPGAQFARALHVSIRAPARGATAVRQHASTMRMFRSALPRGERQLQAAIGMTERTFRSALPRGERHVSRDDVSRYGRRFDPRSRAGSDEVDAIASDAGAVSIRAPARGATDVGRMSPRRRRVSIRAPARGATCRLAPIAARHSRFDPRSRAGSDARGMLCGSGS